MYNLYGKKLLELRNKFLSALNNSAKVPIIQKIHEYTNLDSLNYKEKQFKQKRYESSSFINPRIKAPLVDLIIKKMRE